MTNLLSVRQVFAKLVVALLLTAPVLPALAESEAEAGGSRAAGFFRSNERFPILTYEELRRLQPERQIAYMSELREFMIALGRNGLTQEMAQLQKTPAWTLWMSILVNEANAAGDCDKYSFMPGNNGTEICVTEAGVRGRICSQTNPAVQSRAQNCPEQFKKFMDMGAFAPSDKERWTKWGAPASAPRPTDTAALAPVPAPAPTPAPAPGAISPSGAFDKKKFSCIYAGFSLTGSCYPPVYMTNGKMGKVYSCDASIPKGLAKEKLVVPEGANKSGRGFVLCHPVLFGLEKGKPICLPNQKDMTSACGQYVDKNLGGNKDSIKEMIEQNADEYRLLQQTLTTVCKAGTIKPEEYPHVKDPADVGRTCAAFADRFQKYSQPGTGATGLGPTGIQR